MPTPVGPAPRDPDDPDLWEEWYDDDVGGPRFGRATRLVAVLIVVAMVLLVVSAL